MISAAVRPSWRALAVAIALLMLLPTAASAAKGGRHATSSTDSGSTDTSSGSTVFGPDTDANGGTTGTTNRHNPWADDSGTVTSLNQIVDLIGADFLHDWGHTGTGVTVALIDTGVAPVPGLDDATITHGPDLSFDSQYPEAAQVDAYGHGTHMAGIIVGGSSSDSQHGVAPDATLLSLKVGSHDGAVDVSQVIAAINWVVEHAEETGTRVISLSFGTDSVQPWDIDPLSFAVESAWHAGITVVVSAGNDGTAAALRNPAINPWIIAVGAIDTQGTVRFNDDVVADYSNGGTPSRRPDVTAPGTGVVSARVPGGYLDEMYPGARRDGGFRGSGTSQAAAVVAGAAAIMIDADPTLTPDQIKGGLITSAAFYDTHLIYVPDALDAAPRSRPQRHELGTGLGTLDGARGSTRVVDDGVELTGEIDIMGEAWDGEAWAADTLAGRTWAEGVWNGRTWAGTWSGDSWAGRTWAGRTWAGRSWSGRSWSGDDWAGRTWAGDGWDGRSWSAAGWR